MDRAGPTADDSRRLARLFDGHEPRLARLAKSLRGKLRTRLPGLFELVYVYERQRALVLSYAPTERGSDGICAISVRPGEVSLCFGRGAELAKSDPAGLLRGRGTTMRFIELRSAAEFERKDVQALVTAACRLAGLRLDARVKGPVVFKMPARKAPARRASRPDRNRSSKRRPAAGAG